MSINCIKEERTEEQKRQIAAKMLQPLDEKEIEIGIHRISELKPIRLVSVASLFPTLSCCCRCKKKSEQQGQGSRVDESNEAGRRAQPALNRIEIE